MFKASNKETSENINELTASTATLTKKVRRFSFCDGSAVFTNNFICRWKDYERLNPYWKQVQSGVIGGLAGPLFKEYIQRIHSW